jgi:pSer/pThr/pTyr-binding forkhead associated (FHA) protein
LSICYQATDTQTKRLGVFRALKNFSTAEINGEVVIRLTALIEIEGQAPKAMTHESNARSIVIGRDQSADFQLPLSTVSRHHARISEADGIYVVEDLGSTHGTTLNGKKVSQGTKKVLRDGDIIELTKAKITCAIETEKVASEDAGEGSQSIAVKAVQGILGRLGESQSDGPFLRTLTGPQEGKRFDLYGSSSEWALGRSKDCEFFLDDPNVSRRHALIKKDWHGFTIQDLDSRNGVIVNDSKIQKPRRLKDRDEITIGPVKLVFVDPDAELLASLKDVPGFEMDEGDEHSGSNPSVVGAPQESAEVETPPEIKPEKSAQAKSDEAEAEELSKIDPELLADARRKFPTEWLVIGSVGIFVIAAVVLLFVILL